MTEPTIHDIINNEIIIHEKKEEALQKPLLELEPIHNTMVKECNFYEQILEGSQIAYQTSAPGRGNFIWHHGIYIGNKKVIHMYGGNKENAKIRCDSVETFMEHANGRCIVIEYDNDNHESRLLTCYFAKFFLESHGSVQGLYNISSFNCEHFATFCRTGRWRLAINNFIHQLCIQTKFSMKPYFVGQGKLKRFSSY